MESLERIKKIDSIQSPLSCKTIIKYLVFELKQLKCKQKHALQFCKKFKALTIRNRIKFIYNNKFFPNCLSPNHLKSKCSSTSTTLMHLDNKEQKVYNASCKTPQQISHAKDERPSSSSTDLLILLSKKLPRFCPRLCSSRKRQ